MAHLWRLCLCFRWVWVRKTSACWWRSWLRTSVKEVKRTTRTSKVERLKVTQRALWEIGATDSGEYCPIRCWPRETVFCLLREGGACWAAGGGDVTTGGICCDPAHHWRSDWKHHQRPAELWNQRGTRSATDRTSLCWRNLRTTSGGKFKVTRFWSCSPLVHVLQVLLTLKKPREKTETPFLVLHVAHLGIDTKVRKYDMCATTYIKKITMKCLEFKGQSLLWRPVVFLW